MANTTGNDKVFTTPWTTDANLKLNNAVPAALTTFYAGQAVGRDASGNLVQMDDTAKAEFAGFLADLVRTDVQTTDAVGDKVFLVERPLQFTALIASAAAGDEGKKVWWKYNNQVAYTPGTSGNFAGYVLFVRDSTHVTILPPWVSTVTAGGEKGCYKAAAAAATTLTKWDINKLIILPLTSSETITLPAVATLSPGDSITFINTSANTSTPTIAPAGTDLINGANSNYTMSTTQYSVATFRVNELGTGFYVVAPGPTGTVGATTFTGNSGTSSATFTVTDNVAASLAVGPNGATNPALSVDCSVGSAATGVNIVGRAATAGVTVQAISSTGGEALALLGGASTTSTAGGAITITGAAGGATTGAGGAVTITGGAGTAGNSAGGAAGLIGGLGQGSAAGGAITITSGGAGSTGVAGAVNISVGAATAGIGSAVTITAGNGAGSTNGGGNINLVPGTAVSTGTPGEIQVNSAAGLFEANWQQFLAANVPVTGTSYPMFLANRAYRVKGARVMCSSTGTVPTVDIIKDTSTTAPGGGSSVLTGAISFNTTANTVVVGTVGSTIATITLAAGDRLSLKWGGTIGSITGAVVSVLLVPV